MIPDEQSEFIETESVYATSPIDMTVLDQLKEELAEIAPDLLVEFVTAYLLNAPQMVVTIREAVTELNGELLNRTAHSLKSNSARLGAMNCSKLCQELENMGEQQQFVEAVEKVTLLEAEYERVANKLRQEVGV